MRSTAQLVDAMLDGRLIYLLSADMLHEDRAVVLRPKLARAHGLNETEIDALLTEITANALWRVHPQMTCIKRPIRRTAIYGRFWRANLQPC